MVGYSPWGHKELDMTEQLSLTHHMYESVISALVVYSKVLLSFY